MSTPRKRNRAADKKQALIKKLHSLALATTPDRPSDELYDHVEKMIEAGRDADVEAVIDDPSLTDEASDAIALALEEAGYRMSVLIEAVAGERWHAAPHAGGTYRFCL